MEGVVLFKYVEKVFSGVAVSKKNNPNVSIYLQVAKVGGR